MPSNIIENDDGSLTTLMDECNCPQCGYHLDAATGINGDTIPESGDISICVNCAAILEFTEDLTLQILSKEELRKLTKDVLDDITLAQTFILKQKQQYH